MLRRNQRSMSKDKKGEPANFTSVQKAIAYRRNKLREQAPIAENIKTFKRVGLLFNNSFTGSVVSLSELQKTISSPIAPRNRTVLAQTNSMNKSLKKHKNDKSSAISAGKIQDKAQLQNSKLAGVSEVCSQKLLISTTLNEISAIKVLSVRFEKNARAYPDLQIKYGVMEQLNPRFYRDKKKARNDKKLKL